MTEKKVNLDNSPETSVAVEAEVVTNKDEITVLQEKLAQALDETKVHQEQYLRALADMENLRKRTQRDKEDLAKYANENILREILPVIDNLERAVEHAEQAESDEGLFEGVQMTLTQFGQLLNKFGVETVDAMGQTFDPAYHQAMGQMESENYPVNTVVQQMQKGYQLNKRLLRPAFVMLAKKPTIEKPEDIDIKEADVK
ncbi:MAG: nucleotide exchange factor GrpE [Desulfuromusa sp.]|nr:nucleotide exchange factor GrpE [Desulfuromusa sp.]